MLLSAKRKPIHELICSCMKAATNSRTQTLSLAKTSPWSNLIGYDHPVPRVPWDTFSPQEASFVYMYMYVVHGLFASTWKMCYLVTVAEDVCHAVYCCIVRGLKGTYHSPETMFRIPPTHTHTHWSTSFTEAYHTLILAMFRLKCVLVSLFAFSREVLACGQ